MDDYNPSNEEENINNDEQNNSEQSEQDEPKQEDELTENKEDSPDEDNSEENNDYSAEEDEKNFLTVAHTEEDDSENEYRYCPECGNKCLKDAVFCNACGEKLIKDYHCPDCGTEYAEGDLFCTNCGKSLKQKKRTTYRQPEPNRYYSSQQDSSGDAASIVLWILLAIVFILLISVFVVAFGLHAANNIPKIEDIGPKAPNCEADTVKELAVSIFKDNNEMFKSIDPKSIASVVLKFPSLNSYDQSIDKYNCSGEIWVLSNDSGFLPLSMESNNDLYNKIAHEYSYYGEDWYWDRYTKYVVPVEYTSQLSEGSTLVSLKQYKGQAQFSTTSGNTTMPSRRPKRIRYEYFDNDSSNSYNDSYDNSDNDNYDY